MTEYDELYDGFSLEQPAKFNFASDVVDRWAEENPDQQAIYWIDDDGNEARVTFAEHARRSRQVASVLSDAGVQRGDIVLLVLGRQLAWWEVVTACLRGGFVVSPGTSQLSAKDLALRINASSATAIVTDAMSADKLDSVADQCPSLRAKLTVDEYRDGWISYADAVAASTDDFEAADTNLDDAAICYFTSGTTGLPKMVTHSQGYGLAHQTTGKFWLDLSVGDLHWNISDTGWAKAAWSSYFGPWNQGATLFIHHAQAFDPVRTLAVLNDYPITTMCGAPTIYRMLVQQDLKRYQWNTLRHCVGAGEPLNPEIIDSWKEATGITIRDGYGQTESVILCGAFPSLPVKPGSMGKPAPGIDLQTIDHEGNVLPANEEGDIAVRVKPNHPLGLFKGYNVADEEQQACFVGDWYITGDRAYRDEDGYFWFVGRADDVIISAGYRIGPFEVESALLEHDAVAESAVVSSPDDVRGEVVKAFVVLTSVAQPSDTLAKELQDHVKSVTAPYKYPRKIEFVSELPKTVSGKIRRVELRNQEWQR